MFIAPDSIQQKEELIKCFGVLMVPLGDVTSPG
jgi:hypothetical protein